MKNLTDGNIYKNFILFSIPLVLAGLMSQAYNLIDTIIVGKYLGDGGLAAIGATSSYIQLISSVLWGIGTGTSLYVANLFGARKFQDMTNSIKLNLAVQILLSVVISLITIALTRHILNFLCVDKEIYGEAMKYFIIYTAGLTFITFNNYGLFIFNAIGNTAFPFYMSIISCVMNIAGNIFLITVFNMGVTGAAISTVVSAGVVTALYIIKLFMTFKEIGTDKQKIVFDKKLISRSMKYGIPCMIQQSAMYLSSTMVQPFVNVIGSAATAGYCVGMKVYSVNAAIYQNSSKIVSNYSAHCMGGKTPDKIKIGIRIGLIQAFVFSLPLIIVCLVFPKSISSLFFREQSSQGMTYAIMYIKICMPFIGFAIVNNLYHSLYKGVKEMNAVVFSTCVYSVVRIAASFFLAKCLMMKGIYIALNMSWIAEFIVCVSVYYFYFRKKYYTA